MKASEAKTIASRVRAINFGLPKRVTGAISWAAEVGDDCTYLERLSKADIEQLHELGYSVEEYEENRYKIGWDE